MYRQYETPGHCIPISYEQMYSCVYKCVCKQFSERLYQDVIEHMSRHLATLSQELQALTDTPFRFLDRFASIMNQYLTALGGIVPIFNYMNRFYVETKLKTDLNEELRKLFQTTVVDTYISLVLTALEEAHSTPFSVPPATMSSLVKNLYSLSPDYANIKPHVFSVYIPNIYPPTSAGQLEEYMRETQLIQQQIKSRPDFQSLDNSNSRKRTQDDLSV
ncbi:CDK2-associated and cullin domain-containing protein 1-like isoform X2 [Dreissena polymorpha]|uniref:CDK2-associated and cullin domain-containing protein 1-like isoform X2 n=1 Tax=Dreissena polymorpha TaxID=45954 RepID=UPI002263B007|nr:CDK2-associated and cullin domain-containing protein 1-like isoform X2 [Dreissena polymorpha]